MLSTCCLRQRLRPPHNITLLCSVAQVLQEKCEKHSVDETNIKFKVLGGALAAEMVKMESVGGRLGFALQFIYLLFASGTTQVSAHNAAAQRSRTCKLRIKMRFSSPAQST